MLLLGAGQERPRVQMRHPPLMEMTRRNCPQATTTPSTSLPGLHCPRREQPWSLHPWGTTGPFPPSLSGAVGCPTTALTAPHPLWPPCPAPRTSTLLCSKPTMDTSQSSRFPSPTLGTPIKNHSGSTAMPRRGRSPAINPSRCTVCYGVAEMPELPADLTTSLLKIQARTLTYFWKPIQPLSPSFLALAISSAKRDLKSISLKMEWEIHPAS